MDEGEEGCEAASELVYKPQGGGSIPLASSTNSADDSTLGVLQNHAPSRSTESVHPSRCPFTLLERRDALCDGYLDTEASCENVGELVGVMLLGDVRPSTMTCFRRMD